MAVEKLQDLSQPIDVELLDATVSAFYGTGSKEEISFDTPLGLETEYDERPDWPSEPSVWRPLSPEADLTCDGVEISGIDSDRNSVASDSRLNVREESDWEEEDEGAIDRIEQVMATPEQEEPLQDPDQEFSCSGVEISGIDSDWNSEPLDSLASDWQLNVIEESDWEEEGEGAIDGIEHVMASPEQEEPLQNPDQELSCSGVEISGIDSDWNSEPLDSVGLDSQLNVREESDWEEEDEEASGWIEQVMASPEQEEPLQDSDQEFSFSFYPEGLGVNPNLDSDPVFVIQGDYVDPDASFTAVPQQILRNEIARRDNSPASARVVENLPLITVSEGGLGTGDGLCAVCKDKYVEGEKVKVLPCVHRYHQDCILPWLKMHNTCPVCRFELPKEDLRLGVRRTVRDGGMHGDGLHSATPI